MRNRYFNIFIYLFVLTIVVGAFAAIALNDYGVTLIAIGCFGLSAIIFLRIYSISTIINTKVPKTLLMQEYILMGVILLLFGFRALRIKFDFVEMLFVICTILMVVTYLIFLRGLWSEFKSHKTLKIGLLLLYASIILFFTSMSVTFINYSTSVIIGAISFILAIGFLILHFSQGNNIIYKEKESSLFKEVFQYFNLSPLILTMILLMSFYMGLHQINILPSLYTGEVPARYQELLEEGIDRDKETIDGVPRHEIYWEEYQSFIDFIEERKSSNEQKD
jgi:hypothetical protein